MTIASVYLPRCIAETCWVVGRPYPAVVGTGSRCEPSSGIVIQPVAEVFTFFFLTFVSFCQAGVSIVAALAYNQWSTPQKDVQPYLAQ